MALKDPKAIDNDQEMFQIAKEKGIKATLIEGNSRHGCFFSRDITVHGKKGDPRDRDIYKNHYYEIDVDLPQSEAIPGLHCPDCDAQAYITDHPKVATCGAYPGWFFFYEGIKSEGDNSSKNKIVMKYVNGVLQPVIETEESVNVEERKV